MTQSIMGDVWESRWTALWAHGLREAGNVVHWQGDWEGLGSDRGRGRVLDRGSRGRRGWRTGSKGVHKRDMAEKSSTQEDITISQNRVVGKRT